MSECECVPSKRGRVDCGNIALVHTHMHRAVFVKPVFLSCARFCSHFNLILKWGFLELTLGYNSNILGKDSLFHKVTFMFGGGITVTCLYS